MITWAKPSCTLDHVGEQHTSLQKDVDMMPLITMQYFETPKPNISFMLGVYHATV